MVGARPQHPGRRAGVPVDGGRMQGLGFARPGDFLSEAASISRDGSTIVGSSSNPGANHDGAICMDSGQQHAHAPIVFERLHSFSVRRRQSTRGHDHRWRQRCVRPTGNLHAAEWVGGAPSSTLGLPAGYFSAGASGLSDDGSVVIGSVVGVNNTNIPAVWTVQGVSTLADYLAANGVCKCPRGGHRTLLGGFLRRANVHGVARLRSRTAQPRICRNRSRARLEFAFSLLGRCACRGLGGGADEAVRCFDLTDFASQHPPWRRRHRSTSWAIRPVPAARSSRPCRPTVLPPPARSFPSPGREGGVPLDPWGRPRRLRPLPPACPRRPLRPYADFRAMVRRSG